MPTRSSTLFRALVVTILLILGLTDSGPHSGAIDQRQGP